MCAVSAWYAYCVWDRIPFAASNLVTSVTAVRSNIGLAMYAYISLLLVFGWSILWTIGAGSTLFIVSGCDSANGICENDTNMILLFLFFLSFYWTVQVIMNVV
jgi:Plasma-membrane choline transporter